MASSAVSDLKGQLTCCVCLELYTNPKTLPCLHSFCLQCIEWLPLDPQGDGTYMLSCPTCRHCIQLPPEPAGAAAFPSAFHLNNLMETYSQMNKVLDHQKTCPNHQKPLEINCISCGVIICLLCTKQNHKHHDWDLVAVDDRCPKDSQESLSVTTVKEKVDDVATNNVATTGEVDTTVRIDSSDIQDNDEINDKVTSNKHIKQPIPSTEEMISFYHEIGLL